MRPLGEALAAAGFAVHAVRLAGHGTTPDDLARTGWRDWLASAEAGLAALRAEAPRVVVVGMSLGTLLGLLLAARHGTDVEAVVCAGTPLRLADRRTPLLRSLRWVPPLRRRFAVLQKRGRDISDPVARAASTSYDVIPLPALLSLLELRRVVRRELAAGDAAGARPPWPPRPQRAAVERRAAAPPARIRRIEAHVLERSWHVVTEDVERDLVARLTIDFLARLEAR